MITYEFEIGESIRIPLLITDGSKSDVTALRANMKPALEDGEVPPASTPVTIAMSVADGGASGWIVQCSAAATSSLSAGLYAINVALDVTGGITIITPPCYVQLRNTTTT